MTAKQVDFALIQARMKSSPKFRQAMEILARRQRGRQDTTFSRLHRMLLESGLRDWTAEDLKTFFTMLETAGAGKLTASRSDPMNSRFLWFFQLQSVACRSLGLPEPKRTKKDGTAIEAPEGEMRRQQPPRRYLPKIAEPTPPVAPASTDMPAELVSEEAEGNMVRIRRGGAEFDLDLTKVPPEALRLRRFVG